MIIYGCLIIYMIIVQCLGISVHSIAAQLSQHTRWNEKTLRVVLNIDLSSLEDRAAELRQLFADILLLWSVRRLMGKDCIG